MKITLTRVFKSDKKKDGTPLIGKNGKPYTKLSVKCQEYGDKWLSGFANKRNEGWKEGDVVEVEVEEKDGFLNYSLPKLPDGYQLTSEMKDELNIIKTMLRRVIALLENEPKKDTYPEYKGEPNFDNMP